MRTLLIASLLALAAGLAGCMENPYTTEESGELEDEMNNAADDGPGAQPGAGSDAAPDPGGAGEVEGPYPAG